MNRKMIFRLISIILLIEAVAMLIPGAIALYYGEDVVPFIATILLLVAVSLPGVIYKPKNTQLYAKDGFVLVTLSWILMSLFGCLPFIISRSIPNFADAFFETVSGFTTTGATILSEIQSLPKGILFWRSLTHWIGGMGVLMLMLAIVPSGSGSAIHLLRAEVPGPTKEKIVPKMRQTSLILYGIYVALTVLMVFALLLCGLPKYDSVVTAIATAGTGGFSVLNSSIAGYGNVAAEWVVSIFMFLFGVNFNIYFLILIGRVRDIFKSEELRVYSALVFCASALIVIDIGMNATMMFANIGDCIRASFFQVTSIMSTTGFCSVNFDLWPEFSKAIIFCLLFTGACAGSTAGGLKISRLIILFKCMLREIKHVIRPNSVNVVKVDKSCVKEETVKSAMNYFGIYSALTLLSFLLLSLSGFDIVTNLTSVITCINNVGPGLGEIVGPVGNFSAYSDLGKLLLSLDMLLGRLEIMPMLITVSAFANAKK